MSESRTTSDCRRSIVLSLVPSMSIEGVAVFKNLTYVTIINDKSQHICFFLIL